MYLQLSYSVKPETPLELNEKLRQFTGVKFVTLKCDSVFELLWDALFSVHNDRDDL